MTAITNPTLTAGISTFFRGNGSPSATLTLYGVQSEVIRKSSNMIDMPLPVSDSNAKLLFDLLGANREITIEGKVTSADVTLLYNYANDLAGLMTITSGNPSWNPGTLVYGSQGNTGNAQIGYTYTSEILNRGNAGTVITMKVYVMDVQITGEAGNPNSFNYTITLQECSGSSA